MHKLFFFFFAVSMFFSHASFSQPVRRSHFKNYHYNFLEKTYCWKTTGDTTPWLDHIHAKGDDSENDLNPPVAASSRQDAEYQLLNLNQPQNIRTGPYVNCQMMIENISCILIR